MVELFELHLRHKSERLTREEIYGHLTQDNRTAYMRPIRVRIQRLSSKILLARRIRASQVGFID